MSSTSEHMGATYFHFDLSSASGYMDAHYFQVFGTRLFAMSSASGCMGAKYFQEFGPIFFDMSSASGYMGEKYFQEFGPIFFDMSSASGYMGEKYFQEFGPRFLGAYPLAHTPLREVSKERGSCTWPHILDPGQLYP